MCLPPTHHNNYGTDELRTLNGGVHLASRPRGAARRPAVPIDGGCAWDDVRFGLVALGASMWTVLLYAAFVVAMVACLWFIISSFDEGA